MPESGGLQDIRSALQDTTRAINALAQQVTAKGAASVSFLTLTVPTVVSAATYSMLATDTSIIASGGALLTVTLVSAAAVPGRLLFTRTVVNFAVSSASANVVPLIGGAAGTAILAATAGKWAILQSDGTNWQIMAAN